MQLLSGLFLVVVGCSTGGYFGPGIFAFTNTHTTVSHVRYAQAKQRLFEHDHRLFSSTSADTTTTAAAVPVEVNAFAELETAVAVTTAQAQGRVQLWNQSRILLGATTVTVAALVSYLVMQHFDSTVAQNTALTAMHHAASVPLQAFDAYENVLSSNPVATKAATSASVYSIGDILAQYTEQRDEESKNLDQGRVLRSMIAGGVGHGPLSHIWYHMSENFFTNIVHLTAWWSFIPKIVVDQTVWGPIWNSMYILMIGLMRRENLEKMVVDVKTTVFPLFLDGLKLWPLAHVVTYGLIPEENRLLWVDTVEIVWVSMLATKAASLEPPKGPEEER
jgi:protein Mpv17